MSHLNPIRHSFQYGEHTVTLETGRMARQAQGAVFIDVDGTSVLATVAAKSAGGAIKDFFPLTVNYQEKTYAAGKIPGGFLKREGRPSEMETLTSRLIDRPVRPLFPKGFYDEVQVIATVMSLNPAVSPDVVAMLGVSAALVLSGLPMAAPLGAARVGYIDDAYVLNPSVEALERSALDLVMAGTPDAVLMVESEAQELSEQVMLDAVLFGHEAAKKAIEEIMAFSEKAGVATWDWTPVEENTAIAEAVSNAFGADIKEAYNIREKADRQKALSSLREKAMEQFVTEEMETSEATAYRAAFAKLEKTTVRTSVLKGEPRIDGRDTKTVRPIAIETGVLERTHGSALFTRGETQAIVACTLGTARDAQILDGLMGESKDNFMLHYNFPPYCVGEVGFMGSPKRREIGHGRLARRGVEAVLPDMNEFPYVLRVVSEITESNGSSSMASVCGTSLALMDAGVPLTRPVAGIAMGLIKEGDDYAVITDILGDEDHLGDMDFKVAGTREGVTALQMDIKIDGITRDIMETALAQAHEARAHILGLMEAHLPEARESLSDYAPLIFTMKVPTDKIRDVIGKGGVTIRAITEETGSTVDINDDGEVQIFAPDKASGEAARDRIAILTAEPEVDKVYRGSVVKIMDFGAFVSFMPGKEGLVHISQIAQERINQVTDVLSEGDEVIVKLIEIDRQGRSRLSMKVVTDEEKAQLS